MQNQKSKGPTIQDGWRPKAPNKKLAKGWLRGIPLTYAKARIGSAGFLLRARSVLLLLSLAASIRELKSEQTERNNIASLVARTADRREIKW